MQTPVATKKQLRGEHPAAARAGQTPQNTLAAHTRSAHSQTPTLRMIIFCQIAILF